MSTCQIIFMLICQMLCLCIYTLNILVETKSLQRKKENILIENCWIRNQVFFTSGFTVHVVIFIVIISSSLDGYRDKSSHNASISAFSFCRVKYHDIVRFQIGPSQIEHQEYLPFQL